MVSPPHRRWIRPPAPDPRHLGPHHAFVLDLGPGSRYKNAGRIPIQMAKRLGLALLLCLVAGRTWAAVCASQSGCTSAAPCDWSKGATWTCGRAPNPTGGDTCLITANTTVVIKTDAQGCGQTTIDGTLLFDESSLGRDADGYRTFTVVGDVIGNSGGLLRLRAGHRLAINTAAASRILLVNDGFKLDVQGEVQTTTIAGFADGPPNTGDCGPGAPGREFTITPAAGGTVARRRGRVVFMSGKARNRQMEIRSATLGNFRVCTDLVDSTSGSDTSGGQRLTPHANRSAFCRGPNDPSDCCTGHGAGTCPGGPAIRHSEPAPYGNSACTGDRTPYACCTGSGQGRCTAAVPAPGDQIAIVRDAWIYQVGGTRGYRIEGDMVGGNNPMPTLRAANIANAGTNTMPTTSALEFIAKSGIVTPDIDYLNFHDFAPTVDGIRLGGVSHFAVRWSAIHDVTPLAQGDTNAALATWYGFSTADFVEYADNLFYRTQGVAAHLNETGLFPAAGNKFLRNIIFDTCMTGTDECGGMQADNTPGGETANNLAYDIYAGDNPETAAFTFSMQGAGAVIHDNWIVNSAFGVAPGGADVDLIQGTAVTRNYISHISTDGGGGGNWYSNVVRNYGLASPFLTAGIANPVRAMGNYILGAEESLKSSGDCTGLCGSRLPLRPCRCAQLGIRYVWDISNNNAKPSTALDNIVASLGSYPGYGLEGRCVEWDGYDLSGSNADANWDTTVEHLTCDGRSPAVPITGLSFDQGEMPLSPPITLQARDLVMLSKNDGWAVKCSVLPGVNELIWTVDSQETGTGLEGGGDYAADWDCAMETGITRVGDLGYLDHSHGDYNFGAGAPGLVGGSEPPGSPIGARAFRFRRAALQSVWSTSAVSANAFCAGAGLPSACCTGLGTGTCSESIVTFDGEFPADVANVDNRDTDDDGVMDLHDNCIATANPSQLDGDGDGAGAGCDCNDGDASIHPGGVEVCNGMDDDCDGFVDGAPPGVDPDLDRIATLCDNCPLSFNPDQLDVDSDGEGDYCDLDDGLFILGLIDSSHVGWQPEAGFDHYNLYRGNLAVLKATGVYTQDPQLVPSASRQCGLATPSATDGFNPGRGQAVFYLVTGIAGGIEGSLGTDSAGTERINSNPCPP